MTTSLSTSTGPPAAGRLVAVMGDSFTNIQIRLRGSDALEVAARALEAALVPQGWQRVPEGPGQRNVILARSGDWVAAFDQATDEGNAAVDDVGARLSKATEGLVVSVRVEDSSVLELQLFDRGQHRDTWNTNPDYKGEVDDEDRAAAAGNASRWSALLGDDATKRAFKQMLRSDRPALERQLREAAKLLGIRFDQIRVGYGHDAVSELPSGIVRLAFAKSDAASYERRATGAPKLAQEEREKWFTREDEPKKARVFIQAKNLGGEGRGLEVRVSGSLVEQRLARPKAVMVGHSGDWHRESERGADPKKGNVFTFPDAVLPAACIGDLAALMRQQPHKARQLMEVSEVWVGVDFEVHAAGSGELRLELAPLQAPNGAITAKLPVTIEAPPPKLPRPLFARKAAKREDLKDWLDRSFLVMLVSFDCPCPEAARFVAKTARKWHNFVANKATMRVMLSGVSGYRPLKWTRLEDELSELAHVSADTAETPWPFGNNETGFSFDGRELPTFALWTRATRATSKRATDFLRKTAEHAMLEADGVQALVTRTGRVPFMSLDETPYERVCSTLRGSRLSRTNLTRYARAVAPGDLWLGAKLAKLVDRRALARVVPVEAQSDVFHVVIPDEHAKTRAIEKALRAILPVRQK